MSNKSRYRKMGAYTQSRSHVHIHANPRRSHLRPVLNVIVVIHIPAEKVPVGSQDTAKYDTGYTEEEPETDLPHCAGKTQVGIVARYGWRPST